jgi:hypothetical protein
MQSAPNRSIRATAFACGGAAHDWCSGATPAFLNAGKAFSDDLGRVPLAGWSRFGPPGYSATGADPGQLQRPMGVVDS